jgi:hypothetical protein
MPLYELIRKYRVWQIVCTSVLLWAMVKFILWITASPYIDLKDWHLAPITAALPALIAGTFGLVNTIMKRNEKDEDDK